MLFLLLRWLEPWLDDRGWFSTLEVVRSITFRASMASLTAFVAALVLGPAAIRVLGRHCPERVVSDSADLDALHRHKQQTPSMGGLFLVPALLLAALLWADPRNVYVLLALFLSAGLGLVGAVDDALKIRGVGKGLSVRWKLLGQAAFSAPVAFFLYLHRGTAGDGVELLGPFWSAAIPLGVGFVAWGVLVMIASSNAVNLTDGLDGLAGGCLIFAGSGMGVLAYLAGHRELAEYLGIPHPAGVGELAIVLGAMVGAVLGFLWFNCYPAQVFMGDTGSLPLGGLLGLTALAIRQEFLLLLVGGVFAAEAASVVAQVVCYQCVKRRILLCAPVHHHFQFQGWHEAKIVVRFWIVAALLAILAVASLKLR